MTRNLRIVVSCVCFAVAAASCSIPSDSAAQVIPPDSLPESLRPDFTTTTSTIQAPITTLASIFLLTRQAETTRATVVDVQREVPINPTITDVISRLFGEGAVTAEEEAANYITTLTEFELLDANHSDGLALIDIVNLTPEGTPSDHPFEGDLTEVAAQLVWTATAFDGIDRVQILINGERVIIPTNHGDTEVGASVSRADYDRFDPNFEPPSTTTTTSTPPTSTSPTKLVPSTSAG